MATSTASHVFIRRAAAVSYSHERGIGPCKAPSPARVGVDPRVRPDCRMRLADQGTSIRHTPSMHATDLLPTHRIVSNRLHPSNEVAQTVSTIPAGLPQGRDGSQRIALRGKVSAAGPTWTARHRQVKCILRVLTHPLNIRVRVRMPDPAVVKTSSWSELAMPIRTSSARYRGLVRHRAL